MSGHPGLSDRGTNAGLVYIVSATGYSQSRAKSPHWLSAREPRITYKHHEHQPLLVSGLQMPRMTTWDEPRTFASGPRCVEALTINTQEKNSIANTNCSGLLSHLGMLGSAQLIAHLIMGI